LCMQHKAIPGHLHLETLNPHIKLEETPFVIPTQLSNWPARTGRRYAGVSAAGLSGTNAHVVLEEAPEPTTRAQEQVFPHQADTLYLLPISANDPEALRQLAETYRTQLLAPDGTLKDIPLLHSCYTASVRRTHYTHRLALVGASHEELALQLETF